MLKGEAPVGADMIDKTLPLADNPKEETKVESTKGSNKQEDVGPRSSDMETSHRSTAVQDACARIS